MTPISRIDDAGFMDLFVDFANPE